VNVLGFDTATAATAVCVVREDGREVEVVPGPERLTEPPAHARELMPAVARAMGEAELDFGSLEALAVGVGPGTFTGLRIGVSTARALAHASGLELRPVSSLAALAEGIPGPRRLPLIDAKRGELFAALYEDGRLRWGPVAATAEAVGERAAEMPEAPRAAGDGAVRFRGVLEAAGIRVEPAKSGAHVARGLYVCRLGVAGAPRPPEAVLPEYLRVPDAKPR
jgi:tRNA threonylcarbamoyladenosine biosynthesis protein TsaB